jgi:hypothetical protein
MDPQQPPTSEELPLKECPFCDYSLEGLPVQHKCPECGREGDRRWKLFGSRLGWKHWSRTQRTVCTASFAAISLSGWYDVLARPWVWGSWELWLNLFSAAGMPVMLWSYWRFSGKSGRFVAVGPDVVCVVRRKLPDVESYPLRNIKYARAGANEWVILKIAGEEHDLCRFPNGAHEAEDCAQYINSQLERRGMIVEA